MDGWLRRLEGVSHEVADYSVLVSGLPPDTTATEVRAQGCRGVSRRRGRGGVGAGTCTAVEGARGAAPPRRQRWFKQGASRWRMPCCAHLVCVR